MLNSQTHHQKCQEALKQLSSDSFKFSMLSHFGPPYWNRHFLFIDIFSVQIRNQHLQKPAITKYRVHEK